MINVFMLGHKSQAGKDTLANILIEKNNFIRFAFADKLKSVVQDLYNFNHDQMHGNKKNDSDIRYKNTVDENEDFFTPRRILQLFGQDQRRLYPDIWASYVFNSIEKHHRETNHKNYVITDFRFPNEYSVAKLWSEADTNRKLYTIKIARTDLDQNYSGSNDISETALDNFTNWNTTIQNYGLSKVNSIDCLYEQFQDFLTVTLYYPCH
jgi:hypothetical protein